MKKILKTLTLIFTRIIIRLFSRSFWKECWKQYWFWYDWEVYRLIFGIVCLILLFLAQYICTLFPSCELGEGIKRSLWYVTLFGTK